MLKWSGKIKAAGVAAPTALNKQITAAIISAKNQGELVMQVLTIGAITSFGLRDKFGIMNPSARISMLRKTHNIGDIRVRVKRNGKWYRNVALYFLVKESMQ